MQRGVQPSAALMVLTGVRGGGQVLHPLPCALHLSAGGWDSGCWLCLVWAGRNPGRWRPRLTLHPIGVHYGGDIPGSVVAHSWQGGPGQAPLGSLPERASQARHLWGQLCCTGLACLHRGVYPTVCPLLPAEDTRPPWPGLAAWAGDILNSKVQAFAEMRAESRRELEATGCPGVSQVGWGCPCPHWDGLDWAGPQIGRQVTTGVTKWQLERRFAAGGQWAAFHSSHCATMPALPA